ncbi:MAG: chorismate mutase [Chloroflexota bacterium]|nr:chorismate mutase [Chloroflexota bacterium]
MWCRGVRGATIVSANTKEEIVSAGMELLQEMVVANGVEKEDVASVLFTTTQDLNAEFPAVAARQMGWTEIALLGGQEIQVEGSMPMCLRILLLINTEKRSNEIVHVYLKGTEVLRQGNGGR